MEADVRNLIQAIHDTPTQAVLAIAGAGTTALSDLLLMAGASRTLLEAIVPYSTTAFDGFLDGEKPSNYVSSAAARSMAGHALTRARLLANDPLGSSNILVGVACTAALATDRERKGEHRAHIAIWRVDCLIERSLTLTKGARDRAGEERIYSRLLLNALAAACGLDEVLTLDLQQNEEVNVIRYDYVAVAEALLQNELDFFALYDHGELRTRPATNDQDVHPQVLLAGAFNPLHDGHLGMACAASKWLDAPVAFELSVANVDKPSLPVEVVLNRIAQFAGAHPIYVSNAPTYQEKSRLYPGATFVVGYDTAKRLFYPKYYGNSETRMFQALQEIKQRCCRFLVSGRVDEDGIFRTISDLKIPPEFLDLFDPLPEATFRMDISSSELRQRSVQR